MLADELPEIKESLKTHIIIGDILNTIQVLTDYTERMLQLHNIPVVAQCMKVADKIYTRGNIAVKNAIENIFVFSFSSMRTICTREEWKLVQAKTPVTLYSTYVRQVNQSGS
jgi:hypothetical protein